MRRAVDRRAPSQVARRPAGWGAACGGRHGANNCRWTGGAALRAPSAQYRGCSPSRTQSPHRY